MKRKTILQRAVILAPVSLLALGLFGCGGGTDGGTGGSGGGGGAGVCTTNIVANEANDYSFSSTLTFPPIKVKPKADLLFDWSGVTADLIRHNLDPKKDLDSILVFEWDLTVAELEKKINSDTVAARDMTISPPLSYATDGNTTSRKLLEFSFNGSPIGPGGLATVEQVMLYFDPSNYDPSKYCYTVMAATGDVLGQGTRMIQAFVLDESSSNTTVTMTKDSTKLEFHADLTRLTPTTIPANTADINLDWSKMQKNALGADFSGVSATSITSAFIGHYNETPAELSGDKFLDLELIATTLYRKSIEIGTSVKFSDFKDEGGNSFSGIDDTGTWLIGLQCGACRNPAPWYISVLKPCG
jgi:hypothetical protein